MRCALSAVCLLMLSVLLVSCGGHCVTSSSTSLAELLDADVINLEQWPASEGGNDHFYGIVAVELYRDQVGQLISTYDVQPWQAYLATITSPAENVFILNRVTAGTDQPSVLDAFWLDARCWGDEWMWSTGEPFGFVNWAPGEPSYPGVETAMTMWGPNNTAYNRTPGTWNDAPPDNATNELARFWALVEFE